MFHSRCWKKSGQISNGWRAGNTNVLKKHCNIWSFCLSLFFSTGTIRKAYCSYKVQTEFLYFYQCIYTHISQKMTQMYTRDTQKGDDWGRVSESTCTQVGYQRSCWCPTRRQWCWQVTKENLGCFHGNQQINPECEGPLSSIPQKANALLKEELSILPNDICSKPK